MITDRKTGYIALLDVLGFSELIARETRNDELQAYFEALDMATNKGSESVEYVLFSDTIVISTPSDNEEALLALLRACSHGMRWLLKAGLPVRGAISHGSYLRSKSEKGVLIAGPAFIEAYRFEKAQDWVGIVIAPSVLRSFAKLKVLCASIPGIPLQPDMLTDLQGRLNWARIVQPCNAIPWHIDEPSGLSTMDGYAVVPTAPLWGVPKMAAGLGEIIERLTHERSLAANPKAQRKYDQPLRWINFLKDGWQAIAHQWRTA